MTMPLYPAVRPQTIGEVLDTAFKIFSLSLLKTLPYGMLITLASQALSIYNLLNGRSTRRVWPQEGTGWVLYVASVIVSLTLWAALIIRAGAVAQGGPVSVTAELSAAVRALPGLIVVMVVTFAAVGVGTVLLIIPGVYLLIALQMSAPLVVLEGAGPLDALKSSFELMRGHWWRTFAILLVVLAIYFVFAILAGVFALMLVQFERGADVAVVTATTTVLVVSLGAFSAPFIAAVILALLGDLMARSAARLQAATSA